jgi:hypothetical protein
VPINRTLTSGGFRARALLALVLSVSAVPASAAPCPVEPANPDKYCTSQDLIPSSAEILSGPSACTAGEIISLRVRVKWEPTTGGGAAQRYDIGFFVGDDGGPVFGGASCTFDSLRPQEPPLDTDSGAGGFRNLDGDACGDLDKTDRTYKDLQLDRVLCRDDNGDGQLDLSYIISWDENQNDTSCTDPANSVLFEPVKPKCISDVEYDLPIVVEPPPTIEVGKVAIPSELSAPGGPVRFYVTVHNGSVASDPVTITSLVDDIHGDLTLARDTTCSVPRLLEAGVTYRCSFSADVTGPGGTSETDTVTASGTDDEGNAVTGSGSATVDIVAVAPTSELVLFKFASPTLIAEPGGLVDYTVFAINASLPESIVLESLDDDLYGDLNGKGTCRLPVTLTRTFPLYRCTFSAPVTGLPGDVITDTIVATARDRSGRPLQAQDSASVRILDLGSEIEVRKSASTFAVPEPGDDVTFDVTVQNVSAVDTVTINSLVDDVHGDLNGQGTCSVPQVLPPAGGLYSCSFTVFVGGNAGDYETDLVTAQGIDDDGNAVEDRDGETVKIFGVPPQLEAAKVAVPPFALDTGSPVLFVIGVQNTSSSADPVTLTSLVDDVHGDLNGRGTCSVPQVLAPAPGAGSIYVCSFTATVPVAAIPAGGTEVDTVTAAGVDDEGTPVTTQAQATVQILGSLPSLTGELEVRKFAAPDEIPEPGGTVGYGLLLVNPSDNPGSTVTVSNLVDVVDGVPSDLSGDCPLPIVIAPGDYATCVFSRTVSGPPGTVVSNTVTASGQDALANPLSDSDSATVTIIDVASSIDVSKQASPTTVSEPGGDVTFTVTITNTSPTDTVTIQALTDDVHGNLAGRGTCVVPQVLAPSATYACSFTAFVGGSGGDVETDTVTVSGVDDDGIAVSGSGQASVSILDDVPDISALKNAVPTVVPAPAGTVRYSVSVTNESAADVVTITSLVDSEFGDLNGQGSCSVPQILQPGGSYTCEFDGVVRGSEDDTHYNEVTVGATSDDGDALGAQAAAVVGFSAATPIPATTPVGLVALGLLVAIVGFYLIGRPR